DDLPADEAVRFKGHLAHCDKCREAIDQGQWIDDLLQSPIRLQLDCVPVHLVESARRSMPQRRRVVRLAACGLAAAATLVVAVGWWELNGQAVGRVDLHANRGDIAKNVHVM